MAVSKLSLSIVVSLAMALAMAQLSLSQNSPTDFLAPQNAARLKVGLKPLIWNTTLASDAEKYVTEKSGDCILYVVRESQNNARGSGAFNAANAVKEWLDEDQYYDRETNACCQEDGAECQRYKHIVCRNTISVGCARAHCKKSDEWLVTCNYYTPGNYCGSWRPY
ncbi:pathogenesis-related leaf protein 6-like [Diospyros lotus]|uniref:pathogenesis-related leaf protein 6-like n=1 Tax=Diospyros lotus TaxID=55363 RepID=UPI002256431B|nr:pathogenesis-related leaf protein 6-like [Diospyros lotus]